MPWTTKQRRAIFLRLYREELHKLKPSMPGRYSGQQVAYAKGRAGRRFAELEKKHS